MKNKIFTLFAVVTFVLVGCDGSKNKNDNGDAEVLVKTFQIISDGETDYPTKVEFNYNAQNTLISVALDGYEKMDDDDDEEEGDSEDIWVAKKIQAAFTYNAGEVSMLYTAGSESFTMTATVTDNLITKIENLDGNDDTMEIEYDGDKISKVTRTGTILFTQIGGEDDVEEVVVEEIAVFTPAWNGNQISKIDLTRTTKKDPDDESKDIVQKLVENITYTNIDNKSNIDLAIFLESSDGIESVFANPGAFVGMIGQRTDKMISEVSTFSVDNNRYTDKYTYTYTTNNEGYVTKIKYSYKYFDNNEEIESSSGELSIEYIKKIPAKSSN